MSMKISYTKIKIKNNTDSKIKLIENRIFKGDLQNLPEYIYENQTDYILVNFVPWRGIEFKLKYLYLGGGMGTPTGNFSIYLNMPAFDDERIFDVEYEGDLLATYDRVFDYGEMYFNTTIALSKK